MTRGQIHIAAPQISVEAEQRVLDVLRSGHLAQGAQVEALEALCREMTGATHAVAMCNGTATLEAALEVIGLQPGDEVITTPLTFSATLNAILRAGAVARFADVGDDYTIDPEQVGALINARTRALLPVHLYGLPADMTALTALARTHGLIIVEDAAQAHGAACEGVPVGQAGLGSFSFYATKNVTSGEGGVVTTSDDRWAHELRLLRNQGMSAQYVYERVGRNLRLSDIHAAVVIPQLQQLDAINARRGANAQQLHELLANEPQVERPTVPHGRRHVWHQYTILLDPGVDRGRLVERMNSREVFPGIYYPKLVHDYEVYRSHPGVRGDLTPRASDVARRCLSLPVHHGLGESEIERVASALLESLRQSP